MSDNALMRLNSGNRYGTGRSAYRYRSTAGKYQGTKRRRADMPLTITQKAQVRTMVKRLDVISKEPKYYDRAITQTTNGYIYNVFDLIAPLQGASDNQRDGDQIEIRDIELKYDVYMPAAFTVANGSETIRVIIVQYFQDTNVAPLGTTPNTVVQSSGQQASYLTPFNHDRRRLFKVLYDACHTLSLSGPVAANKTVVVYPSKKKVNFMNDGVEGEGKVFLMVGSSNNTANGPLIDFYSRVNFVDA